MNENRHHEKWWEPGQILDARCQRIRTTRPLLWYARKLARAQTLFIIELQPCARFEPILVTFLSHRKAESPCCVYLLLRLLVHNEWLFQASNAHFWIHVQQPVEGCYFAPVWGSLRSQRLETFIRESTQENRCFRARIPHEDLAWRASDRDARVSIVCMQVRE
jgi:hypothetical protein